MILLSANSFTFEVQKFVVKERVNPLPNCKILDWSKLKACADDEINVIEMMISLCNWVENFVGKGENAGYKYFLLFPQFLAPLAIGQRAYVMVRYLSCMYASVRA